MKTAMQELIELLELNTTNEPLPHLIDIIKEVYIKKEKDIMYHSFYGGVGLDNLLDDIEGNFEDYYNSTFNQSE